MTVSVAELSLHLAEYLARVRAGETIFVEDDNHVLAKLAPVSETADLDRDEMADLVRRGLARPPIEPSSSSENAALLSEVLAAEPGPDVVAALLAEREDGR